MDFPPGVLNFVPAPAGTTEPFQIETNSSTYAGIGKAAVEVYNLDVAEEEMDYESRLNEQPLLLEQHLSDFRGVVTVRRPRDVFFAVLFVVAFVAMVVSGIIVRASSRVPLDAVAGSLSYLVFDALRGSLGILAAVVVLESVFGCVWLLLVRTYVKVCVWGTMITTPFLLCFFGIWTLSLAVPHTGTTVVGWMSLVGGAVSFLALIFMYKQLGVTVSLFQLATSVLLDNWALFWVAIVSSSAFLLFASLWVFLFGSLFLLGNTIIDPATGFSAWTVDPTSYIAMSFYLFMFLWTSAVVYNAQVFVISGVTCQWFFHRNDLGRSRHNPVKEAAKRALSTSFGSICLASLILAVVQFLRWVLYRLLRPRSNGELDWFSRVVLNCANFLETIVAHMSHLAVAYMALGGSSFFTSTRMIVDILKRNMLDRIVIDWAAHVVLWVWSAAISAFCAFGVYLYSVNVLLSPYSWVTALVSFSVAHAVMQFYSRFLLDIIDALFLCYALDCDNAQGQSNADDQNQDQNAELHQLMSKHFGQQIHRSRV